MASWFEKQFIGMHTNIYRWTGGRIGSAIGGVPVLLLTTTGRKTGRSRTTPLGYFEDGGDFIVVASNGGRPARPAWYWNLTQTPQVTVQVKDRVLTATAAEVRGAGRDELWRKISSQAPAYAPYARPELGIPLVRLHPTAPTR